MNSMNSFSARAKATELKTRREGGEGEQGIKREEETNKMKKKRQEKIKSFQKKKKKKKNPDNSRPKP